MDAQRALLDELMGAARNLSEDEKKGFKEIIWDDKEVCGSYMVRFCPHDLFVNTRSDLGACNRIHDPKLKERFGVLATAGSQVLAAVESGHSIVLPVSKPDRQAARRCLKSIAGGVKGLSYTIAAGMRSTCGIPIPYKISPATNLDSVN